MSIRNIWLILAKKLVTATIIQNYVSLKLTTLNCYALHDLFISKIFYSLLGFFFLLNSFVITERVFFLVHRSVIISVISVGL